MARLTRQRWMFLAGGLLAWALLSTHANADDLRVQVDIRPNDVRGPISPYIFGAGLDPKTNPLRFPRYPDKVLRDIADSGLRIARYPGGFVFNRNAPRDSWANFYWQDQIGKNPEHRPTEVYDIDTFLQLCERFGIEPLMQINFVGEPEASVRGYIEYLVGTGDTDGDGINWAARRAANGHPKPYKITYWELGNELHSYEQGFHETSAGAQEYARALDRLVPIVRKMAPGAKIVVPFINLERPRSELKLPANLADINVATSSEFALAFLRNLRAKVDYFDWHFYPANGWGGSWPYLGTDNEWRHYYCWATKFRECHDAVAKLIHDECKQVSPPKIIVGEWSGDWTAAIFPQYPQGFRGSMMRTMSSAVYMADVLMYMMGQSVPAKDIHAAFWHIFSNDAQALFSIQTTREQGISYKGKSTDEGYGYRMPIYWVFKLLSEQRGENLVGSELRDNSTISAPADGLYSDPPYEFARVAQCASRSGDKLYLALLNKDAHVPVEVQVSVKNWKLQPTMQVYEVGTSSYLAENTVAQPDRVTMSGPHTRRVPASGEMVFRLEPNTLAVLEFQRGADGM